MEQSEKQNLKEYDLPFESFIGGWFIPNSICDKMIEFYNNNKHMVETGFYKEIRDDGIQKIDKEVKESEDLLLHGGYPFYPTNLYLTDLQKCLVNYCTRYSEANEVQEFGITQYNMQYYPPGGGFKKLHCERGSEGRGKRHLVFMTYLNDLPNGGTEFHYQNIKTEAKKGLTLIFPTDWTHSHKGVISKTHEKYIVTGWYHYGNYK